MPSRLFTVNNCTSPNVSLWNGARLHQWSMMNKIGMGKDNSRKSVTWSAVPDAPMWVYVGDSPPAKLGVFSNGEWTGIQEWCSNSRSWTYANRLLANNFCSWRAKKMRSWTAVNWGVKLRRSWTCKNIHSTNNLLVEWTFLSVHERC